MQANGDLIKLLKETLTKVDKSAKDNLLNLMSLTHDVEDMKKT